MKNLWCLLLLALAVGTGFGCEQPAREPVLATTRDVNPASPTAAQPKLKTLKLWLGTKEITAELAMSMSEIQTGMMFRTNILESEGMLFVFNRPFKASFWMRNTLIPLAGAYIDPEGAILEVVQMKAKDETPIEAKTDRVQYVLEMKEGWFERNGVAPGAVIRTEKGSLSQTFFGQR